MLNMPSINLKFEQVINQVIQDTDAMASDLAVTTPQQHWTVGVVSVQLRELLQQCQLNYRRCYLLLSRLTSTGCEEDLQDLRIDHKWVSAILLLFASIQPYEHAILDTIELKFRPNHYSYYRVCYVMEDAAPNEEIVKQPVIRLCIEVVERHKHRCKDTTTRISSHRSIKIIKGTL